MVTKQFEIPCDRWVELEVGEDQQWRMSFSIKCRTIYMAGQNDA